MKIAVDNKCSGHGLCYATSPDLLECDDAGFVSIRGSSMDVPESGAHSAGDARDSCPEGAISLIE